MVTQGVLPSESTQLSTLETQGEAALVEVQVNSRPPV